MLKGGVVFICSSPNRIHKTISNPHHIREFYLEEFCEMMNGNFKDVELFGQFYTPTIIIIAGKLLSVFPKEWKIKDLVIQTIYRKRNINISKFDLTSSNPVDKTYRVSPFKKSLFTWPRIIISVAKNKRMG